MSNHVITWRNVTAPNQSAAASLARSGGEAVTAGAERLSGVVGDIQKQALAREAANTPQAIFQREQEAIGRQKTILDREGTLQQNILAREQQAIAQGQTRQGRESQQSTFEFNQGQTQVTQANTLRGQAEDTQQRGIDRVTSTVLNALEGSPDSFATQSSDLKATIRQEGGTNEQANTAVEQLRTNVNRSKLSAAEGSQLDTINAGIDAEADAQMQVQRANHARLVESLPLDGNTTPEQDREAMTALDQTIDQQIADLWLSGNDSIDVKQRLRIMSNLPGVTPSMVSAAYHNSLDITGGGFFGKIDMKKVQDLLDGMVADTSPGGRQKLIDASLKKQNASIIGFNAFKISQKAKASAKFLKGLGIK